MKKILIISTNAIGDTYLSMSAIPSIKAKFPNAEIYFLISENSKFLFENTDIKDVYSIGKSITDLIKNFLSLRIIEFDYIFSFFPGRKNSILLKMLISKNKGGFLNFRKINHWADKSLNGTIQNEDGKEEFKWTPDSNFLLLVKLILMRAGFPVEEVRKFIYDIRIERKYNNSVLLHPVSKIDNKSLSKEQIFSIVNVLTRGKNNVILLGDNKLTEILDNEIPDCKIILTPNISELIDLVHSKFFISVDSFPLHIADAYNTNFLGIFSNTLPESVLVNSSKSVNFNVEDLREIPPEKISESIMKYFNSLKDK